MHTNDTLTSYELLSDTFDQSRMKTNEWLSMTNEAGSSNLLKTNATTNSTSNTTGAITTAGGLGLGSSATIGGNLTLHGRGDLKSTVNFKDLIHILSEDADEFDHVLLEDNSTTTPNSSTEGYVLIELPNYVDIDGTVQIDGATTVGVDGTGHDVKFFGDTAGSFMLWDQSDDALELTDSTKVKIGDGGDMQLYHDGSNSYITNSQGALKIATETSGIAITLGHSTSEVTVADNLTITGALTAVSYTHLTLPTILLV